MANIKLTPEVTSVIERSTITEKSVTLPPGQLDRKLYESVKKVLMLAGGKWNTPKQAFLFTVDPRGVLGLALNGGAIVDEKQQYQSFYTPAALAARVAEMACVHGCRVLEPSAGEAALAEACKAAGAREIVCVEIRPTATEVLLKKGFPVLYQGDFLNVKAAATFDCVVMNPPFTRGHDLKHIAHALKFVRPGGRLVSIMLDGKTDQQLETLCQGHQWDVLPLGPDAFKSAGTSVRTSILTMRVRE